MDCNITEFINRLSKELSNYSNLITEDLIRHWYIEYVCGKENARIEVPYINGKAAKVPTKIKVSTKYTVLFSTARGRADLYVDKFVCKNNSTEFNNENSDDCNNDIRRVCADEDCVIEFKYHKKLYSSTTAKTDNFGYVFNDMNRLSLLENKHKLLVYVFDDEMYKYYTDKVRCPELCEVQGAKFSTSEIYSRKNGNEFKKCAFTGFSVEYPPHFNYNVEILYEYDFNDSKFYLRIYEIH